MKYGGYMEKLLHTPEGVRDIYNMECRKKLALEEQLHKILRLHGYHDIQTPTFEFFDVFRKEPHILIRSMALVTASFNTSASLSTIISGCSFISSLIQSSIIPIKQ